MPKLVVDSSVAVKWFLSEAEQSVDVALAVLDRHLDGEVALIAPDIIVLEVINALARRGVSESDLGAAARSLLELHVELVPVSELVIEAATLASEHGMTAYDAAFAALAVREGIALLTADRRLADVAPCDVCRLDGGTVTA
jgi:predicted nucleic acid-binding protein